MKLLPESWGNANLAATRWERKNDSPPMKASATTWAGLPQKFTFESIVFML